MGIDLLDDGAEGIDLLDEQPKAKSSAMPDFEDLSPEDQSHVMEMAKQGISKQHPNMPDWLRDAILKLTPTQKSPMLESAARGVSNVTDYIPAIAGGALQGASIPIRGAAGLIPSEFTQNLANSPDLRGLLPQAHGTGQKSAQMAAELLGGGGLFGKIMQGLKGGAALAGVPGALQAPLALGGAGAIATPGDKTDRALGAAGALALGGAGKLAGKIGQKTGEKLPEFMRGLTSKSTPEALVAAAQKPHDVLQNTADELYGQVRSAIGKRDIKIPVNEDYINQAHEILGKTRANRKLIDAARSGDYEAVHELQSHLWKKGTKGSESQDLALENQGEEILDLRDKINDDLEKHLITEGHADIAHVLKQGKKVFAELKDTYYHKNLPKGIGKLVHPELRKVPKNPENLFDENSVPMKRFLAKHPEVAKHSQGILEKEKALKSLNSIFLKGAGGSAIGLAGKGLYDLFK
jgi:hypothetical protein